jgi:acetoacetyl-CoA synthetase
MADFARFVAGRQGVGGVTEGDYSGLHAWSVTDVTGFWSAASTYLGVRFVDQPSAVLEPGGALMPGARWFPGATLNYAEHALAPGQGRADGDLAVVCARESGVQRGVSHGELRDLVARARFAQIEAAVLIAVDGYRYGGRQFDVLPTVRALLAELPTVRAAVLIPYGAPEEAAPEEAALEGAVSWAELVAVASHDA